MLMLNAHLAVNPVHLSALFITILQGSLQEQLQHRSLPQHGTVVSVLLADVVLADWQIVLSVVLYVVLAKIHKGAAKPAAQDSVKIQRISTTSQLPLMHTADRDAVEHQMHGSE